MIEPSYRRDQLWKPRRCYVPGAVVAGGLLYMLLTIPLGDAEVTAPTFIDDSPRSAAEVLVTKLVRESFPAWREHHAGCPRRLSQLLPNAHLDPWGHALHYTCDPRLASGGSFAVFSAGADGVFGTPDDIAATNSIAAP